jgi:hypothetical protein
MSDRVSICSLSTGSGAQVVQTYRRRKWRVIDGLAVLVVVWTHSLHQIEEFTPVIQVTTLYRDTSRPLIEYVIVHSPWVFVEMNLDGVQHLGANVLISRSVLLDAEVEILTTASSRFAIISLCDNECVLTSSGTAIFGTSRHATRQTSKVSHGAIMSGSRATKR